MQIILPTETLVTVRPGAGKVARPQMRVDVPFKVIAVDTVH